ncbi:unnamed protein product [Kuraishia capsulata CBS 1993]|uniref:Uncharacterized protein n=1 Tax=Kuraishia capsulata CBS 1993 TaxID=1382522 RepID=W6MKS8_9ASCO|nr:uncharacterized protein KUCA_T00003066001 [Kuraishia capsulata CBS 1993]CDK27089.1 unnamed protein product [Kuraishia capsulata CBS 1993]
MSTLRRKEKNEENFVGQPRQKSKSTASTLRSLRLSFSAVERKLIDHTFGGHRHPVYYESSTESDPESDSGSDLSEEFREKLLDIKETQHQAHAEEATVKQVVRVRYRFLDRLKNVFF